MYNIVHTCICSIRSVSPTWLADEVKELLTRPVFPDKVLSAGHASAGIGVMLKGRLLWPFGEFHGIPRHPEPHVTHDVSAEKMMSFWTTCTSSTATGVSFYSRNILTFYVGLPLQLAIYFVIDSPINYFFFINGLSQQNVNKQLNKSSSQVLIEKVISLTGQ